MTKLEFLATLEKALAGLPKEDCKRIVDYYCEMIDDRMEDGFSEEDAVKAAGTLEEIAQQAAQEAPAGTPAPENAHRACFVGLGNHPAGPGRPAVAAAAGYFRRARADSCSRHGLGTRNCIRRWVELGCMFRSGRHNSDSVYI